jgi:hypothetical protein
VTSRWSNATMLRLRSRRRSVPKKRGQPGFDLDASSKHSNAPDTGRGRADHSKSGFDRLRGPAVTGVGAPP